MKQGYCILVTASLCLAAVVTGASQQQRSSLASLIPAAGSTQGWTEVDSARIYEGQNLYLFIDGGADLFFEYGFRQALAIEYQNARGSSLSLEIFEMRDPGASYGIYSIRSGDGGSPIDIGQEGNVHPYYIMFWKGRWYVSVAGSDSTPECRKGLDALARAVDGAITDRGHIPGLVNVLPEEGLLNRRYFRGFLGLSTMYVFGEKDMFQASEGVFGTYGDHTIIVLRYDSEEEAERRFAGVNAILKGSDRVRNYRFRDQLSLYSDGNDQVVCLGRSRAHLVLSIAPDELVARSSCRGVMSSSVGQ